MYSLPSPADRPAAAISEANAASSLVTRPRLSRPKALPPRNENLSSRAALTLSICFESVYNKRLAICGMCT